MSYEVTATRKRPITLDGLIGQEFVVATLKNSIQDGRIAHAYLFSGPRGVGKTSAARILARSLNCPEGPNPEGCDSDPDGDSITRGNALDVIEIDGASNTSVNDVREIKDEVLFPPNNSRYKIYIIDEVHMLSTSAFNALLKTIEEPPPYIIFIFATTELHKVPATIKSRCQQFHFRLIPLEQLLGMLKEAVEETGLQADHDALVWIAKEGRGSLRDAYTLFDQVASFSDGHITLEKIKTKLGLVGLDRLNRLAESLADLPLRDVLALVDEILTAGVSVDQFIIDLNEYYRNLLLLRAGIKRESVIGYPIQEFSGRALDAWSEHQLMHALDILLEAFRRLRYTVNERFELELVVSELSRLSDYLDPGQLLNQIHDLRRQVEQGDFRTGVASPADAQADSAAAGPEAPGAAGAADAVAGAASTPAPAAGSRSPAAAAAQPAAAARPEATPAGGGAESAAEEQTIGGPAPAGDQSSGGAEGAAADTSAAVDGTPAAGRQRQSGSERRELPLSEFERLIEEVGRTRMALASALGGAIAHTFDDDFLYLRFTQAYATKSVELEADVIEGCIHTVLGVPLRVKVETVADSSEQESQHHPDPQVEMARRTFRGRIVSG